MVLVLLAAPLGLPVPSQVSRVLACLVVRIPVTLPVSCTVLDYNKNLVLFEDLNFPDIDWNTYYGSSVFADEFAEVAYFLNLTYQVQLTMLVTP